MTAVFWRRFHLGCVLFWIGLWIVAVDTDWINSARFISHISMAALVLTSGSAWQAARAEVASNENPPQN